MKQTVNFQWLINALHERGWDYGRIAQKLGCARATIYMLSKGQNQEPRYHLGAALVDLERRTRPRG